MSKFFVRVGLFLIVAFILARVVICQMRWSDTRAKKIFSKANVDLRIYDTVINDRNIHYVITGTDSLPSLVFIHGSPGSWKHYALYLKDPDLLKKFRLIAIDRPGFGHSDYGKPLRLQEQADVILPLLRSLKTNRPMYLFGHSYGGPLVAELAALDTSLFETIVIAAGALDPALEKKETWRRIMEIRPLAWFLPGAHQASNTELLWLKEDLHPLAAQLQQIRNKVAFIHGDKDTWVPIANIAYAKSKMVNADIIRIDTVRGAAHQIPWKNKRALKDLLMALY